MCLTLQKWQALNNAPGLSSIDDYFYIGSTTATLGARKAKHKWSANNDKSHYRCYQHFNKIGWDHVKIILIIRLETKDKDEIRKVEQSYIDQNKNEYYVSQYS